MSRIAKNPVIIPEGVDVVVSGQDVKVKGKLGELTLTLVEDVTAEVKEGVLTVQAANDTRFARNMWGTSRSLIANLVEGVTTGYNKRLILQGVGYRCALEGKTLVMQLGYSHEVRYPMPQGIDIKCEKPTELLITGCDKQQVGQVAAEIYNYRRPEPYKGKGFRYEGQRILRKEGKKK